MSAENMRSETPTPDELWNQQQTLLEQENEKARQEVLASQVTLGTWLEGQKWFKNLEGKFKKRDKERSTGNGNGAKKGKPVLPADFVIEEGLAVLEEPVNDKKMSTIAPTEESISLNKQLQYYIEQTKFIGQGANAQDLFNDLRLFESQIFSSGLTKNAKDHLLSVVDAQINKILPLLGRLEKISYHSEKALEELKILAPVAVNEADFQDLEEIMMNTIGNNGDRDEDLELVHKQIAALMAEVAKKVVVDDESAPELDLSPKK